MIAALFVETNGCYFGLPGVDAWDEKRDARLYAGSALRKESASYEPSKGCLYQSHPSAFESGD